MNEKMMLEIVERMLLLAEENAVLRTEVNYLERLVKSAEIEAAENRKRWGYTPEYNATISADDLNELFGWRRAARAVEIIEGMRKENEDGDAE